MTVDDSSAETADQALIIDPFTDPHYVRQQIDSAYGKYLLEEVLIELNKSFKKWNGEDGFHPRVSILKDVEQRDTIFYWAIAETAKHAILSSHMSRNESVLQVFVNRSIGWPEIEPLMELATQAQLTIPFVGNEQLNSRIRSQSPLEIVSRIYYSQVGLQIYSSNRIGHALLLYGEAPLRRFRRLPSFPLDAYHRVLRSALGTDLRPFLLALGHIYINAHRDPRITNHLAPIDDLRYDKIFLSKPPEQQLLKSAHAEVISLLSADPQQMKAWMREQVVNVPAERLRFDAPNPLCRFPLVRCVMDRADCCVAPLPHLLNEWVYGPLMHCIFEKLNSEFTSTHLSQIFEEYVGLIADICSPDCSTWIPESELGSSQREGDKVVDWAMEFQDAVVLIDAKRCHIKPAAKYEGIAKDWQTSLKTWAQGFNQATQFWQTVQAGRVPSLAGAASKPAFVIIVTHGDADFRAHRTDLNPHLLPNLPSLPGVIISIDQFERLMVTWSKNDRHWLTNFLQKACAEGSSATFGFAGLPVIMDGPLMAKFIELVKQVETEVAAQGGH